jgi:virginiamycin B lyase
MRIARSWIPVALAVALSGCAQQGGSLLPQRAASVELSRNAQSKARAIFRIAIPKRHHARGARYVSSATQSIAITVTPAGGGTATKFDANLTPATNPNCTPSPVVCTLAITLAPGNYTADIATYDGPLAGGNPTGNRLSANQSLPLAVKIGAPNSVNATLDGIPASVAFIAQTNAQFSGDAANGFTLSKCATPQRVTVLGVDADDNFIFGAGAPTPSLSSDDTADLAVATPAPASPNSFTLSRPRIPAAFGIVHLTAKSTPFAGAGTAAVSTIVKVSYNGDICGVITEFTIPTANSQPWGITRGNGDGTIWFTEDNGNKVGRITISTLAMHEFTVPTANAHPRGITAFFSQGMWFTEYNASRIGKVATDGTVTDYPTSTPGSHPLGITYGFDSGLWFTESSANNIGRMSSSGAMTNEFPLITTGATPYDITVSPDGSLWFTECTANQFGRITYAGVLTEPWGIPSNTRPRGIVASFASGDIWFAESSGAKLGRLTDENGVQNEIPVPGFAAPQEIVLGPDRNPWATDPTNNTLDTYVFPSTIKQTPIPTAGGAPLGLTLGDDGSLWFTEYVANKIGRLQ